MYPIVLLLAALVSAPAAWSALRDHTMPVDVLLARFLIAVPVCALLVAFVRAVTRSYGHTPAEPVPARRRRTDRDRADSVHGSEGADTAAGGQS